MSNSIKEANDINSQELVAMLKHTQYIYSTNDNMPEFYRAACILGINVCIDIIRQYDEILSAKEKESNGN